VSWGISGSKINVIPLFPPPLPMVRIGCGFNKVGGSESGSRSEKKKRKSLLLDNGAVSGFIDRGAYGALIKRNTQIKK
jgi:hypothetical protein